MPKDISFVFCEPVYCWFSFCFSNCRDQTHKKKNNLQRGHLFIQLCRESHIKHNLNVQTGLMFLKMNAENSIPFRPNFECAFVCIWLTISTFIKCKYEHTSQSKHIKSLWCKDHIRHWSLWFHLWKQHVERQSI